MLTTYRDAKGGNAMKTMFTEVTPLHLPRRAGRICGAAVSAGAAAILLSGCNSSTSMSSFDAGEARQRTEAVAPTETVEQAARRGVALAPRVDTIAVSTAHGEATIGDQTIRFRLQANCDTDDTTCTWTETQSGASITVSPSDRVPAAVDTIRAVLTKNGITLLEGRGGNAGPNYRIYGTWMTHGAFAVETAVEVTEGNATVVGRGASAYGERTGTRPTADATWRGVMVGTPARGGNRDNILQGDARLVYSMAGENIDATFDNIVNLDRQASHSVTTVQFTDVPVDRHGIYGQGTTGNRIEGAFYGLNHVETGGVFEQNGIVGAYGARRR